MGGVSEGSGSSLFDAKAMGDTKHEGMGDVLLCLFFVILVMSSDHLGWKWEDGHLHLSIPCGLRGRLIFHDLLLKLS